MWTASFWRAVAERAIKTLAQSLLAMLAVGQTTILTVDWQQVTAVALTATLLSVLSSIVSAGMGNTGPSLASEAIVPRLTGHAVEEIEIDPSQVG